MNRIVNEAVRGKRVFVGLSGGVDSAVTAASLEEAGADVTGVFIKGWYPPGLPCTYAEDRRDAMRVAAYLHIPFYTLDASMEYKQGVIDYLLNEYRAGRTPNPDIMCNKEVKFGAFYDDARRQGADFIATGHYARLMRDEAGTHLYTGSDPGKDQSYFLWAVPGSTFGHTLFPLGSLPKSEVRERARKHNLPVATKPDSQGICFLGSVSVDDFLRSEFDLRSGSARDTGGRNIGTHDGCLRYTLGQKVALTGAPPGPWYVLAKDVAANTLTVGHALQRLDTTSITLSATNWFSGTAPVGPLEAQYRYHGPRIKGVFDAITNSFAPAAVLSETPAPGQSLVLYKGEECLGGGIISST